MKLTKWLTFLLGLLISLGCLAAKPALMLPKNYQGHIDVSQYWISEKLDGVRARWDGRQLWSRGGQVFAVPAWFVADFPAKVLDGELWLARGRYADTWSIVSKKQAHQGWESIRFMLFDLPEQGGDFSQRLIALEALGAENDSVYLQVIPQFRLADEAALQLKLQQVVEQEGEGLILHHQHALYESGRSDAILKLKPVLFATATVIAYKKGKGKFSGKVGSLQVRTETGQVFYIGSGLTTAERENPPALSTLIRFKYQGLTKTGLPRFPVFLEALD